MALLEKGTCAEDIELARAGVAKAVAAVTLVRITLDRQVALADCDVASHQEYEIARAGYDRALAGQRDADAALALTGPRSEDIAQARAAHAADQATLNMAERRQADASPMWQRILALVINELLTSLRDRKTRNVVLIAPRSCCWFMPLRSRWN